MITKMTMVINQSSNKSGSTAAQVRVGEWTESFYRPTGNLASAIGFFLPLCRKRAALLGNGGAVIGQRYQEIDPIGSSQTGSSIFPGSAGVQTDIPQMCLICKMPGGTTRNIGRLEIRGIPDSKVNEGEYNPTGSFPSDLQAYFTQLTGFSFKGRDLAQTAFPIMTIAPDINVVGQAIVTTNMPTTYVFGNMVRILRTIDSGGDQVGGLFPVTLGSVANVFKIGGWTFGACTKGKVRLDGTVYPTIDGRTIAIGRIIVKKVGRPSKGYVGKHSTRH